MRNVTGRMCLGLLCAVALSGMGCRLVFIQPQGVMVTPTSGGDLIVQQAPPPLMQEAVPVCPGPAYVWTQGYWNWHGNHHEWRKGRWVVPPRRAAVWVPAHWEKHDHGWRLIPGHWR